MPIGTLRLFSGRLCLADPRQPVPPCPEVQNGDLHISLILIQPEQRPRQAQVAALLIELSPGRPARWDPVHTLDVGEVILLCDADTRWRIDELESDMAWPAGFVDEVVEPMMSGGLNNTGQNTGRGGMRLWAQSSLPDPGDEGKRAFWLIQNGNAEGSYRLWRGRDRLEGTVCLMLDLGVLL